MAGNQPIRLEVKPSFGNLVVWKVIYEIDDKYYMINKLNTQINFLD